MKQIALVVEGQTEERFVKEVLNPYMAALDAYCTPMVPPTKRTPTKTFKGGAPWREYEKLTRGLLTQPQWERVGIMLDFYGCPKDAPAVQVHRSHPGYREALTTEMAALFHSPRVVPHLTLHEFETLVLAAVAEGAAGVPTEAQTALLTQIEHAGGDVEAVNDSPATSPSHRIRAAWGEYTKTVDGIRLLQQVPFEAVLRRCPTFAAWVEELIA